MLEHLQEVLDGKLAASTYRPNRFRKERPVLAGIGILIVGLIVTAIGLAFIIANFRSVSPTQSVADALKETKEVKEDAGPLVYKSDNGRGTITAAERLFASV